MSAPRKPEDIKRDLVAAHRDQDWERAKALSQEKAAVMKRIKRSCEICGVPLNRYQPGPGRFCFMHSIANRFYARSLKATPLGILFLLLLGFNCLAVMPTNPAPVVSLLWDPSTGPNVMVTNYFIYYGTASRQYTTKIPVGNVTNATIQLPQRGVVFYFGATAQDTNALESDFSNEVTYGVPSLPPAPNLKPPVRVIAQTAPSLTSPQWADFAEVTLGATQPEQVFRLKIVEPEKPLIAANTSPRPARLVDPPPLPK